VVSVWVVARKLRLEYEGAIYHVMGRGDRREAIPCGASKANSYQFLGLIAPPNKALAEIKMAHWTDERHPHQERFQEHRALVEEALTSELAAGRLNDQFRARHTSLRCVAREIPAVFGSFFR